MSYAWLHSSDNVMDEDELFNGVDKHSYSASTYHGAFMDKLDALQHENRRLTSKIRIAVLAILFIYTLTILGIIMCI